MNHQPAAGTAMSDATPRTDEIHIDPDNFQHGVDADDFVTKDFASTLERELTEANQRIGNLLARIHRDGGHYQSDHGTAKACEDADLIVAKLNSDNEELLESHKREARLREALGKISKEQSMVEHGDCGDGPYRTQMLTCGAEIAIKALSTLPAPPVVSKTEHDKVVAEMQSQHRMDLSEIRRQHQSEANEWTTDDELQSRLTAANADAERLAELFCSCDIVARKEALAAHESRIKPQPIPDTGTAPPCIPLEDVKPLVEALCKYGQANRSISSIKIDEKLAFDAIEAFTAKHHIQ